MPPKKPTATETSMRKGIQPLGYAARPETRMPGSVTSPAAILRGENPATSKVNLEDLRAYNASQTPGPSFRDRMRGATSQGRFGVDTANGVIAARGAGPEGGSGGSGTDEMVPLGKPMAFAAEAMRPAPKAGQSGPAVAFAAESMAPQAPPPAPASVQKAVRQSLTQAPGRQQMSMSLRAPGEVGSAGVMTQQARLRGMAEASQLGLPPATEAAVRQQVLAGDYGAPGRAQQALASLPPGAMAAGRSQTLDRELAAHVIAGGAGVAEKKAADKMRYQETALRNTRAAQAGSAAAIDLGLDPLASQHDVRGEQQRRLRMSYQQADQAALERLAAGGDHLAAEALRGGTMPGFTGPVQGVRARTEATNKRVLDEAQTRALDLAHQRYVEPKEIQADADKNVAHYAAQGRVDAATIAAASKAPGNSTDAAALRAWGVQMGERQKLGHPTVPLQAWAQQNQVPLSPALMGKPSTGTPSLATPAAPVGAGPAGGQAQGFSFNPAQQTQIQQLTPQAIANLQSIIAAGPSNPDYAEAVAIMQARGGQ